MRRGKSRLLHAPDIAGTLTAFRSTAASVTAAGIRKFCETERDEFKRRIKNQEFNDFRRFPLSWITLLKRKQNKISSKKTLYATGRYVDSIRLYERQRKSDGRDFLIGIHERTMVIDPVTHQPTKLPMWKVAKMNEEGSSALNIPPRHHWWPYFVEMTKQRVPKMVKSIRRELVKAWNARGKRVLR